MAAGTSYPERAGLNDFIEAYEAAQARDGLADLAAFLPPPDDPLRAAVLRELVRVDLEYGWRRGRPTPLEEYQSRFPGLFADPESLQEITFEEFRLRRQMGQDPSAAEYHQRFGVRTDHWPGVRPGGLPAPAGGGTNRAATHVVPPDVFLAEAALAYCEYRLRREQGADPGPGEFPGGTHAFSVEHGRVFQDLEQADPEAALRLAQAVTAMPRPGADFLDFRLTAELGRGAFGRVYLARQKGLAGRPVALKISAGVGRESQALAQLQHTNIVPVYSTHHSPPFHAVCMPYLGSLTLADMLQGLHGRRRLPQSGKELVDTARGCQGTTGAATSSVPAEAARETAGGLPAGPPSGTAAVTWKKLEGMSYVQAVLWLAARLADGLAHAHERGIVHRDLKPANVLLTDDGQPMLLDFNLSEDTKVHASPSAAFIGGTLPYMAPEQLTAFRDRTHAADARGDIYSLGLIVYELLTGRYPFPTRQGSVGEVLARMIEDRRCPPPRLRPWNKAVSPAAESVVRRCLEPDPARRYQTARELQEDLERQLKHQPLRYAPEPSLRERAGKWVRRHPRLAVAAGGLLAAVLLGVLTTLLILRGREQARWEALARRDDFRADAKEARLVLATTPKADRKGLGEAVDLGRRALDRFHVLDQPSWWERPEVQRLSGEDQWQLRAEAGELLVLLAEAVLFEALAEPARRNELGQTALRFNRLAEASYGEGRVPAFVAMQRTGLERFLGRESGPRGRQADVLPSAPRTVKDVCFLAQQYMNQRDFPEALSLWLQATRQGPQDLWAWAGLGRCYEEMARYAEATACYSTCVALEPNLWVFYFVRGKTYLHRQKYAEAAADFDQTLRLRPDLAGAYLNRALARQGMKQEARAARDLGEALKRGDPSTRIYFLRSRLRARLGDRDGAARDLAEGLRRVPADEISWVVRGLARVQADPKAALADFDQALKLNPRYLEALQNKASVLAEQLGRTREAVAVLDRAVALYPDYVPARAGRGVLLARLGKRQAAHADAEECLRRDMRAATLYQLAGVYALTSRQNAEDREEAFRLLSWALRKGYGLDLIPRDADLDPIRDRPEFRRLVAAAKGRRQKDGRLADAN
jgi:serine/threonine protein kinase/Tfp pilus assembly protein PilF